MFDYKKTKKNGKKYSNQPKVMNLIYDMYNYPKP